MLWSAIFWLMVANSMVSSQPIACQDNEQCAAGQYCEISAKICRECLNCEHLKREVPLHFTPSTCIRSVSECGSCLKGLVLDHRNDVNVCVTPEDRDGAVFPMYAWALIVIGILLLALVVVIVVYMLRNPDSFKILASTRTSFRSPEFRAGVPTNIPDAPPPYNPQYEAVRPESPSNYPLPLVHTTRDEETSQPFIKRAPSSRPQDQRESGDNQSAIPYQLPAYLRYQQPHSPESVTTPEIETDAQNNQFVVHDDETMESNWTKNGDEVKSCSGQSGTQEEDAVGNSGALPAANSMALALRETLSGQPPAKKQRTAQDSNNNMNRESSACIEGNTVAYPSTSHSQTAVVINVQVNNNNK